MFKTARSAKKQHYFIITEKNYRQKKLVMSKKFCLFAEGYPQLWKTDETIDY